MKRSYKYIPIFILCRYRIICMYIFTIDIFKLIKQIDYDITMTINIDWFECFICIRLTIPENQTMYVLISILKCKKYYV